MSSESVFLSIKIKDPSKQFHLILKWHITICDGGPLGDVRMRELGLGWLFNDSPLMQILTSQNVMPRLISTHPVKVYLLWLEMKLNHWLYNYLWGFLEHPFCPFYSLEIAS